MHQEVFRDSQIEIKRMAGQSVFMGNKERLPRDPERPAREFGVASYKAI